MSAFRLGLAGTKAPRKKRLLKLRQSPLGGKSSSSDDDDNDDDEQTYNREEAPVDIESFINLATGTPFSVLQKALNRYGMSSLIATLGRPSISPSFTEKNVIQQLFNVFFVLPPVGEARALMGKIIADEETTGPRLLAALRLLTAPFELPPRSSYCQWLMSYDTRCEIDGEIVPCVVVCSLLDYALVQGQLSKVPRDRTLRYRNARDGILGRGFISLLFARESRRVDRLLSVPGKTGMALPGHRLLVVTGELATLSVETSSGSVFAQQFSKQVAPKTLFSAQDIVPRDEQFDVEAVYFSVTKARMTVFLRLENELIAIRADENSIGRRNIKDFRQPNVVLYDNRPPYEEQNFSVRHAFDGTDRFVVLANDEKRSFAVCAKTKNGYKTFYTQSGAERASVTQNFAVVNRSRLFYIPKDAHSSQYFNDLPVSGVETSLLYMYGNLFSSVPSFLLVLHGGLVKFDASGNTVPELNDSTSESFDVPPAQPLSLDDLTEPED